MTHGDDQQPSTDSAVPDDQAPVPSGSNEMTMDHPLADNQFDFQEFIERLRIVGTRFKDSPLLQIFIAIAVFWAMWSFLFGGINAIQAASPSAIAFLLGLVACLAYFVRWALTPIFMIFFMGFEAVLFKPMAKRVFDSSAELQGPVELAKSELGNFFKALLSILPIVLTACCAPLSWVAAFFLGQAPYLVVVRDYEVVDALKESFERSKRHWHVLVMAIIFMVVLCCIAAAIAIPLAMLSFGAGLIHSALGALLWPLPFMVLVILLMVGGFVITVTAFTTIDELEGLDTMDPTVE